MDFSSFNSFSVAAILVLLKSLSGDVLDDFKIRAVAADWVAENQSLLDAVAAVGMNGDAEPSRRRASDV